jgi:VWFA-related protein
MNRNLPAALVLVASVVVPPAVRSQAPRPQPSPEVVFPSGVEQVTVDVLVFDDKGTPVEGLRREDFTVREDGRPQALTSFEAVDLSESATAPEAVVRTRVSDNSVPPLPTRLFVIVFDDMSLEPTTVEAARKAVRQFVQTGLRAGDLVQVVAASGGMGITERVPEGIPAVNRFVDGLESRFRPDTSVARISDYEAVQIHSGRETVVLPQILRRWYENGVIQEFTTSEDIRSVAQLEINPGAQQAKASAEAVYQAYAVRMQHTLGTFTRVAEALRNEKGRKTVLFVSDGFALDQTLPGFKEVVRAARSANAAFYFVDARGLGESTALPGLPGAGAAEQGRLTLEQDTLNTLSTVRQETVGAESVAVDTGGTSIRNTNDLAGGMRKVAEESRSYYLLGYVPSDTRRDGKFRRIEVEVARPGLKVRARRGYFAPSEKAPVPRRDAVDPGVRAALDAPSDVAAIPLRLVAYGLGPVGGGKSAALVVVEMDLRGVELRKAGDKWTGTFETYAVVSSLQTGESVPEEKSVEVALPEAAHAQLLASGLPMVREFQLKPGSYEVRFVVRDPHSRHVGSVRQRFVVPDPAELSISTPILTDRLQADPAGGARPVPIAHRNFKSGSRLAFAFDVYGAAHDATGAPRLSSSYLVRRADGTVLVQRGAQPIEASGGQVSQMLALSLQGAAPGDYELVLTVADQVAGRTVEVSEPFTVEG